MNHPMSPALRDVVEPGWREREAERDRAFSEFFASLPERHPRQGVAAALVVDRTGRQHVKPVIVVDFYREADLP